MKTIEDIIKVDKFGQLPLEIDLWAIENVSKVEVDYSWLRNILIRLTTLKKLDKKQLAKSDIPKCVDYMLSAVPPKLLKKITKNL